MTTYYAIRKGVNPGIYRTWDETKVQVLGFKGAEYKKFSTLQDAKLFINQLSPKLKPALSSTTSILSKQEPSMLEYKPTKETDNILIVFTDGSARGNSITRNSKASFGVLWPYHSEFDVCCPLTPEEPQTNNRAELWAVIKAIIDADVIDNNFKKTLYIYSDSKYCVDIINKYLEQWKKRGWKKSNGNPPENLDLIKLLDSVLGKRPIIIHHIYGHQTDSSFFTQNNIAVDLLANSC